MKTQETELRLIQSDVNDLLVIQDALRDRELAGYLWLALSPIIGFLAEESHNYLISRNLLTGSSALFETFQKAVAKSRALLKLFDDTDGGVDGLRTLLYLFQQKSSLWMNKGKSGLYGAIAKKWLQPDIGIYFLDEDPIYITIIAFSAIGKSKQEIEALREDDFVDITTDSYSFGAAIGQYLMAVENLMNLRGISGGTELTTEFSPNLKVTHNDFHSAKLYNTVVHRAKLSKADIAPVVLFILSQVNVAHVLLPCLLDKDSNLLIRIQFLTDYHAVRSLSAIQNNIDHDLAGLLSNIDISVAIPNAKKVRNVLAHYGLGKGRKFIGSSPDPLDDVIRGISGISKLDLSKICNQHLHHISEWTRDRFSKTELKSVRALLGDHT